MGRPHNLHNHVVNPWTEVEVETLYKIHGRTKEEIMEALPGRTWSAIRGKAKKLRVKKLCKRVPWNRGQSKLGNKVIREMSERTAITRYQRYRRNGRLLLRKPDLSWAIEAHDQLLMEELERMEAEGFRCIPISGTRIIPDAIAIKDGKVYAVELETYSPHYDKYEGQEFYDDILWIVYRFGPPGRRYK